MPRGRISELGHTSAEKHSDQYKEENVRKFRSEEKKNMQCMVEKSNKFTWNPRKREKGKWEINT